MTLDLAKLVAILATNSTVTFHQRHHECLRCIFLGSVPEPSPDL